MAEILSVMMMVMEFCDLYLIALVLIDVLHRDCSSFFLNMILRDSVPNVLA